MFSWGENCEQGFRVRHGSNTSTDGAHFVNLSYHIEDLSAGHNVLAFLKTNGDAFIIRTNESRDGSRVRGKQKLVRCKVKIRAVSCSDDAVVLLSERGTVLCVDTSHTPSTPDVLRNITVSQVACGSQHSVALSEGGQVYTWGQDSSGQLGLGKRRPSASSPTHLRCLSEIPLVQVAAGGEQSFALSVSGAPFAWGRNDRGQLGLGDTTDRHTPTAVHHLSMKKTVHISCGKDHTATLTKHGAVFTFGSGQYGQLGHNSFSDELRPRLVAELWGAKVTKVACGRYHTLALTDSKSVYSFGCGEQGQLGQGEGGHPSVPLRVQLRHGTDDGPKIGNIYAGENCSFATCTSNEQSPNTDTVSTKTQHSIDHMVGKWTSECDSKTWKKIKKEIHRMFSSACCVNQSFLDQSKDKHFLTSPTYSGLDLSLAHKKLEEMVKRDDIMKEIEAAVVQLLPSLDEKPVGVEGLRIYLLLTELLHVMQKRNWRQSMTLAVAVAAAMQRLSAESLQIIGNWWSSLLPSTKVKYVKVWKQALSVILSLQPVPLNSEVKTLLLLLRQMYQVNSMIAGRHRIHDKTFCLGINDALLSEDVKLWRSQSKSKDMNRQPLSLCNFPFVMDLKSKKKAFDIDAKITMAEHSRFPQFCYFELQLKRESYLKDAFQQLAAAHHSTFKKQLMVFFNEDPKESLVYQRDFFHHLFHDMVTAKSGMFMFNDSKTLAWFPSKVAKAKDRKKLFLFGVLCGLALYNNCIIHLPFPMALFKKLLDVKPTLEDLVEFSPSHGRVLQSILDYEDDVVDGLYMCFVITWDEKEVDLDPQNPEKPLTGQNKKEFVDAYVNYAFNTSVEEVFQEFRRGFFQVCDRDMVKLFQPQELQGVMVGSAAFDWAKLKQNTLYEWEYHEGHPTIQMFWEVFDELTEEQKKDFIWFLTGFRRVPIFGMDQIRMTVRVKQIYCSSCDQHFPESLTCHSFLDLPPYSTKEIMRDRLTQALMPETGFLM